MKIASRFAIILLFLAFVIIPTSLLSSLFPDETNSMDAVIKALYESLSFPEGKMPDLERFQALFAPEAQFIRINKDDTIDRMNRDSFIRSFQERIQKGLIKSFHESEISRRAQVFGRMAHVFSVYKKGINIVDPEKMGRGINSLQLYNESGQWKICAILWMDERSDCPIPQKYLQ